jgi:heme/copper-type cytochrome/quinol oxidase subunit 2
MRTLLSIVLCVWVTGSAAFASAVEPPAKTFDLAVVNGQVAKEQRLIRVDKGTPVKLRISSDAPGSLHLHAYKLEAHVAPGTPAELAFNARATGRFRFEWHPDNAAAKSGDHHGPPLATLEVMPK